MRKNYIGIYSNYCAYDIATLVLERKSMKKRVIFAIIILTYILCIPLVGCESADIKELTKYMIQATYNETDKTLSCNMEVEYVNNSDAILDEVCFHLYPSAFREGGRFNPIQEDKISSAYPAGMSYGGIEITKLLVNDKQSEINVGGQDEDVLIVSLENNLEPSEKVKLEMDFKLVVPNVRHRFGYEGSTVNLGNWYPIACVYENGQFDTHPYYKNGDPFYSECADYKVSITVPSNLTVATSGKVQKVENNNETATYSSKINSARDYAMVIGEFNVESGECNGVKVNYYYQNDLQPKKQLTTAIDAIKTFSNLFGAYPYESYSVVETAFIHGGMEYPSLVYISDEVSASMQTEVIVHETAHQWWYAVVGNDQVNNAWMDEGLTEFTTGMFYEQNPSYGIDNSKRIADALSAYVLYYDAFKNAHADTSMQRKVSDFSTPFEYTYMTYVKGELMFSSIRDVVGEKAFVKALRYYYNNYKFSQAKPDDLIGCFEKSCNKEMKNYFSSWLDGKVQSFATTA